MNELEVKNQESDLVISEDTQALIAASVSKNTLRAYRRHTRVIEKWLAGRVLNDALLAQYITELHQQGKSPATIDQVIAAVKWHGKNQGVNIDESGLVEKAMRGIRNQGKHRGRGQVDGITWNEVERVCALAEADRTVTGLRDSAIIRLMSDCLLRTSEVVAVNVGDFKGSTLLVKSSKTDQEGQGENLYVCDLTRRVIRRYRTKAEIERGALFRQIRRGDNVQSNRLTDMSVRRIIKARAQEAGVEGFISGHSLRVGSAVSLAQAGATVVDMQVAGRWKSSQMPAHYAKAELAERGAIARFKDGKKR